MLNAHCVPIGRPAALVKMCGSGLKCVATMNRVSFVRFFFFADCKIAIPVLPKLIDLLHIVKELDKNFIL